jgi:hypothetical protein
MGNTAIGNWQILPNFLPQIPIGLAYLPAGRQVARCLLPIDYFHAGLNGHTLAAGTRVAAFSLKNSMPSLPDLGGKAGLLIR